LRGSNNQRRWSIGVSALVHHATQDAYAQDVAVGRAFTGSGRPASAKSALGYRIAERTRHGT